MVAAEMQKPPIIRIIEETADKKGVDPLDLPPLYDAIDPDALDALLTLPHDSPPGFRTVQFTYKEYVVTAYDDGRIELTTEI